MSGRYRQNRNSNKDGNNIDDKLIPFLFIILFGLYAFIGSHSSRNDMTMFSFFSYLLNNISGIIFFILFIIIACLNAFALYVFIQTNSETKIDLSDESTKNAAIVVVVLSLILWGCYCLFPLCFVFMIYYVKQGYFLYDQYGEIPTSLQLRGENAENFITKETEKEDRINDFKEYSRTNKIKSPKFKFDKIKDKKKETNTDSNYKRDNNQVRTFNYNKTNDSSYKDFRNNNNSDKKDYTIREEKYPKSNNVKNIKSEEIDKTIDEVFNFKDSFNKEEKANNSVVKTVETKVYSEQNKLDKSNNRVENKPIVEINKTLDTIKNEEISKTTDIKSVDINTNSTEINKVDIGLYKPEISKVEITINKPQVSSISSSIDIKTNVANNNSFVSTKPLDKKSDKKSNKKESTKVDKTAERQKKVSSTTSNTYTMPSLLGSIDISKSILGSTSLASSIEIKPLTLNSTKIDLPSDKK